MKFHPGTPPDEAVIQPETFDAPVNVRGLSAGALENLFHGAFEGRRHWRPGLTVAAGLAAARDESGVDVMENDLADGLARLRAGAPGSVEVHQGHVLGDSLLPQSLYLLLAQQWARAGLLLVHGAALEFEGRGILALGSRGAGKSILTMAALIIGARVVSDDWLMIGMDTDGVIRAERLREFLMLRHGLACDRLLSAQPALQPRTLKNRPKSVICIQDQHEALQPLFLTACRIDQLWLLQRPRTGRVRASEQACASSAEALSALIQASMPLLFSRGFKQEARRLRATANAVATGTRLCSVETGTDIIEDPKRSLHAML